MSIWTDSFLFVSIVEVREKKLSIIRFIVLFIDFLVYGHYGPFTKKNRAFYVPRLILAGLLCMNSLISK